MRALRRPGLTAGAAALLLTGACSAPAAPAASTAMKLSATLTTPNDVTLTWTADPSGHTVEFATATNGPYTILAYVPAGIRTYRHPKLMPQTTFWYRLRPYSGPASEAVEVNLPPGAFTEREAAAGHAWATPKTLPRAEQPQASIHSAGATPTAFKARTMSANGILFTWTDHATDEDGYLLESRPQGTTAFTPIAVLDPNVNSDGITTLPTEKHASYRIRAFTYGPPSNVVHETTGPNAPS